MGADTAASGRLAIRCIRPDLTADRYRDEHEMGNIGILLARAVDATVIPIVIDPRREGPATTVLEAIARTGADAVIVPDLEHVDGIDHLIRERADLITVHPPRVLERAGLVPERRSA